MIDAPQKPIESAPLLGLEDEFPDQFSVVEVDGGERYLCYCHDGVHGLACFSDTGDAVNFLDACIEHGAGLDLAMAKAVDVSFDEAREIAKKRPMPITCLMLLDDLNDPAIHYVR